MVNYLIATVCEFDQNLMPPGCKALHNDRTSGRICPMPRRVIDPDADVSGRGAQILDVITNKDDTARERFGQRRVDAYRLDSSIDSLRRGRGG